MRYVCVSTILILFAGDFVVAHSSLRHASLDVLLVALLRTALSCSFAGCLIGIDSLSLLKIVSVALTIGGVITVTLVDNGTASSGGGASASLAGDLVCLVSACGYGVYTNTLKWRVRDERRVSMPMLFGFVGVANIVLLAPVLPLLHYTGVERFVWPSWRALGLITLNGLIGSVLSDVLSLYTVLLTSPLVTSLGMSLTIPISMLLQTITRNTHFKVLYMLGSLMVVCGFALTAVVAPSATLQRWCARCACAWRQRGETATAKRQRSNWDS